MPYVNIKVTREGVTAEQKKRLIEGTTDLLSNYDQQNRRYFVVVMKLKQITGGVGGKTVTLRTNRKRQ